jgi:peptide/nickel transport system substrate-binding protein
MDDVVAGAFPGTGPYTVASFSEEEMRLVRNPHFRSWDADVRPNGFPDEIVFSFGIEPEQQAEMVAAGDADYMPMRFGNRVAPDTLANLRAAYPSQLHLGSISTMTVFMNPAFPPFDHLEVRQAVSIALDRQQVAESVGGGIGVSITCQILPPAWPGYQPYCPYTRDADAGGEWRGPDLEAARRLVESSGTAGTQITVGPISERNGPIAEHLVSVLNALGYQATLDPATDDETVFGALFEGRIGIGVFEWIPDVVAPATFLAGFTCDETHDVPRVCDEELDALVAEARALQATDAAAATAKWAEVDRYVVDQAFWAPLFNDGADFVSARVGNYQFHPAYFVLLDQLWVE